MVERRQDVKRLEQDIVYTSQQRGTPAAPPKGAQCFDTNTPAEESGDKQTLGVRPLIIAAKRGRAMRFAPRTLGHVSRGKSCGARRREGGKESFLHGCAREEKERVIRQCVSMCACVHYGPRFLFYEFPAICSCNSYIF